MSFIALTLGGERIQIRFETVEAFAPELAIGSPAIPRLA
jgi:hypothetical protein